MAGAQCRTGCHVQRATVCATRTIPPPVVGINELYLLCNGGCFDKTLSTHVWHVASPPRCQSAQLSFHHGRNSVCGSTCTSTSQSSKSTRTLFHGPRCKSCVSTAHSCDGCRQICDHNIYNAFFPACEQQKWSLGLTPVFA